MIARSSSPVSTESGVQAWSASSGMNSMKRTWKAVERANSANGIASSSVKPRIATALTLIGCTSGCAAIASRPRSTCGSESRRVIWKKRSRCERVDRDVDAVDAGLDQRGGVALEQVAVGGQREVLAGPRPRRASRPARGKSRRTSGSPPVSRTSSIAHRRPSARTSRSISSKLRTSARSSQGSPSAGMQYWQRKLQRSVTETRRSEIRRPWPSTSGSITSG